ncbi:hypothetical protein [Pararhizobium sp. A13]
MSTLRAIIHSCGKPALIVQEIGDLGTVFAPYVGHQGKIRAVAGK